MHAAGRDGGREASRLTRSLRGSRALERAHGAISICDRVRMSVRGWSILSLSRAYIPRIHPLSQPELISRAGRFRTRDAPIPRQDFRDHRNEQRWGASRCGRGGKVVVLPFIPRLGLPMECAHAQGELCKRSRCAMVIAMSCASHRGGRASLFTRRLWVFAAYSESCHPSFSCLNCCHGT